MRRTILTAAMVAATATMAYAESPNRPSAGVQYRWYGDLTFTSKTAGCSYNMVGDHLIARLRPAGLGDNGTNSNLTMFYQDYAQGFAVPGPFFTPNFKVARAADIGSGFGNYPANTYIKFLTQSPATIIPSTNYIIATGQIVGFDYTPTCTVNFSVMLQKSTY